MAERGCSEIEEFEDQSCGKPLYSRTRCKEHFFEETRALFKSINDKYESLKHATATLLHRGTRKAMGDYVSLRMRGTLTDEGVRAWMAIDEHVLRDGALTDMWWFASTKVHTQMVQDALAKFSHIPRSSFIPLGGLHGAPTGWEVGFENKREGDQVQFSCSVKIVGVLEWFLERVAPLLFRGVDICESYDEVEQETTMWTFEDGKFTGSIDNDRG